MSENKTSASRLCTCHVLDKPPGPCPQKFAFMDCWRAALASRDTEVARLQQVVQYETDVIAAAEQEIAKLKTEISNIDTAWLNKFSKEPPEQTLRNALELADKCTARATAAEAELKTLQDNYEFSYRRGKEWQKKAEKAEAECERLRGIIEGPHNIEVSQMELAGRLTVAIERLAMKDAEIAKLRGERPSEEALRGLIEELFAFTSPTNDAKKFDMLASTMAESGWWKRARAVLAILPGSVPDDVIHLTKAEIQSKYDRVKWAEGLIRQLPENHDGRNSWLLNYGSKVHDGEGPGPSTLAVAPATSPSASRRGEPSPKTIEEAITTAMSWHPSETRPSYGECRKEVTEIISAHLSRMRQALELSALERDIIDNVKGDLVAGRQMMVSDSKVLLRIIDRARSALNPTEKGQ